MEPPTLILSLHIGLAGFIEVYKLLLAPYKPCWLHIGLGEIGRAHV
jgi:hypothetical protein